MDVDNPQGKDSYEYKFIMDTKEIFIKAQELSTKTNGILSREESVKICNAYVESLIDVVNGLDSLEDEAMEELEMYKIYGKLILFIQAVMIGNEDIGTLGYDLLRWSKNGLEELDEYTEKLFRDAKEKNIFIEEQECYWNLVVFNIITGDFNTAKRLIFENSRSATSEAFSIIFSKLGQINSSWFRTETSLTKFLEWQDDLKTLKKNGVFKTEKYLEWIVSILIGDYDALKELAKENIEYWYQILPAVIFFAHPHMVIPSLPPILETVLEWFPKENMNLIDEVMILVLKNDWIQIAEILFNGMNDHWLVAHVYDLLYKNSPALIIVDGINLRDLAVKNYADSLFDRKLYVSAVDYFMHANLPDVETTVRDRVMEIESTDEDTCSIILEICKDLGLNDCVLKIGKTMSKKFIENKDWMKAFTWGILCRNQTLIATMCNCILENAERDEIMKFSEIDDIMRRHSSVPHVLILKKYCSYINDIYNDKIGEGAINLAEIVLSNHASTKFTFVLIKDLIMVLATASNEDMSIFDAETCHQLSRFLAFFELDVARLLSLKDVNSPSMFGFECKEELDNEIRLFKELLLNEMTRAFV
uniref:Nuclear pore complex protein Nup85 n=1 Tax=Parastrongyloides trichosuri TaxID=131310 RepID=A0A0N5A164_PARTI